jgi:hypothetical protein
MGSGNSVPKDRKFLSCSEQSLENTDEILTTIKSVYKTWKYYMSLLERRELPNTLDKEKVALPFEIISFLDKSQQDNIELFSRMKLRQKRTPINNQYDVKEFFRTLPDIYNNIQDVRTKRNLIFDSHVILKTLTIYMSRVLMESCLMKTAVAPLARKRRN